MIGKKFAFRKSDIVMTRIPSYPELAMSEILKHCMQSPEVLSCLPDIRNPKKLPPREFFWHILNKVKPEYVSLIVAQAVENRDNKPVQQAKVNAIELKVELFEKMMAANISLGK